MSSFKHYLLLAFSAFLVFSSQATDPEPSAAQAPPFYIRTGDTSSFTFSETEELIEESLQQQTGIVEDTVLPPCDILFYKSGKLEYCKIIETTPTTITYKMCDYQDGPNVIVNKSDVHKIRYANGREEVVMSSSQQNQVNAYVKARKDAMSTWALVASLVGLIFVPALIAGIVLGIVSLGRIKRSEGRLRGKGTARAAIIVGSILLFLTILLYI